MLNHIPYQVHSQSKNFMVLDKKKIKGDFILITCTKVTINGVISIIEFYLDTNVNFKTTQF